MRIALIPLDSRPPSWQFPLRLAQLGSNELLFPPRELLGTLHRGADRHALLDWLARNAPACDAAVLSWDALAYGGLVQSRGSEERWGEPLTPNELHAALAHVDWGRCAGYLWLTVPRLGMTIASAADWDAHRQLAQYFELWGRAVAAGLEPPRNQPVAAAPSRRDPLRTQGGGKVPPPRENKGEAGFAPTELLHQLRAAEAALGKDRLADAWSLRHRNHGSARDAMAIAANLGMRSCHVAVEDNARTGPHLDEVADLRKLSIELLAKTRQEHAHAAPPRYTFFDGTDEAASLLTARAILDHWQAEPIPVRLTLYPPAPSPDQYFGLFESHSLEDGLHFLAKFLGLEFRHEAAAQWLVCFGTQPQHDAYAGDPQRIFGNPYLLPPSVDGDEPLFVADLAACNGGNPQLAEFLMGGRASLPAGTAAAATEGRPPFARLCGISAWNTNFNALGFSAATLAVAVGLVPVGGGLAPPRSQPKGLAEAEPGQPLADRRAGTRPAPTGAPRKLLLERLADDYAYQSLARPKVLAYCEAHGLNPMDFSGEEEEHIQAMEKIAREAMEGWLRSIGVEVPELTISFPWQRAFEVQLGEYGAG